MYRLIFATLIPLLFVSILKTQSPYQLSGGKESAIIMGSAGLMTISQFKYERIKPLTRAEIEALDRSNIFVLDRWSTTQHSKGAKSTSDWLLRGSFVLPFTMLLDGTSRKDFVNGGIAYRRNLAS